MAEKLKSDLKVSERRFAWFRARALVRRGQWAELKKLLRGKKCPLPPAQAVRMVRDAAGDAVAKEFLEDEAVMSGGVAERVDLYAEFGMLMEAANTAFVAKSMESLNALEQLCAGKDDALKAIAQFKTRLLSK